MYVQVLHVGIACQCMCSYVTRCKYVRDVQVFMDQNVQHTCTYLHIPAHSDIPTHFYTLKESFLSNSAIARRLFASVRNTSTVSNVIGQGSG
jgi:hypothetical protein